MKRIWLIVFATLALLIVLLSYWLWSGSKIPSVTWLPTTVSTTPAIVPPATPSSMVTSATTPSVPAERTKETEKIVKDVFNAPISFFGRVQDQNGAPVSEAKVEFGAVDKFWAPGSNYQTVSDANGLFSITGIKGAGLTVGVSKEGYDGIKGLSYQSFGYGMPPDSTRKAPPREDAPAVFVLRKKANTEPLFSVHRDVSVPKDGTPVEVSLRTGKAVSQGNGDIIIECWTFDSKKDAQGRYQWRFRLSVPGGGLMVRPEPQLDFEAPEVGYTPAVEVNMSNDASTRWRRDSDEQYWLKLRNGTFARMRFRITTGGDHFVSIMAYLNPSGSRNLEYDENKVIK
jgi:hypothetical protein